MKVGDEYQIRSEGVCWDVPILLQGMEFRLKFFLFPLDDMDVVLGWDWLEGLGEVKTDYKNFTMRIKHDGCKWILQGSKELELHSPTLSILRSATREAGEGSLVRYWLLEEAKTVPAAGNLMIDDILREFKDKFEEPKGLPPPRPQDHAIVLKEGSNIPNCYIGTEKERIKGKNTRTSMKL